MNFGVDVKRVFKKSGLIKSKEDSRTHPLSEHNDLKARHILGLDTTCVVPTRNNSTSTTSTTNIPSVTFSDATTAAVSDSDSINTPKQDRIHSNSNRKASTATLKRQQKTDIGKVHVIKHEASSSSLRSFYDKGWAPLSVSQQTSDSASRDFALRIGTPSIVSTNSQEMEHTKQVRFFTKPLKKAQYDVDRLVPATARPPTSSSQRSAISSYDSRSDAADTVATEPSVLRVSNRKESTGTSAKPRDHEKQLSEMRHPSGNTKPAMDLARAKVNVRRPKAGSKNWFDSIDSDSSEEEASTSEPQFYDNILDEVTVPLSNKDECRTHESPKISTAVPTQKLKTRSSQRTMDTGSSDTEKGLPQTSRSGINKKQKSCSLSRADLNKQSILSLTSSDDESNDETPRISVQELARMEIRASLMNESWDDSEVVLGKALAINARDPQRRLLEKPVARRRVSNRSMTYYDDRSSGTMSHHDHLLTSFPQTPTETPSRGTSLRESILSENDSVRSTKLMTVTRQEESLIAAMRLKKIAMKRAQAMAHRQGALKILELDSTKIAKDRSHRDQRLDCVDRSRDSASPIRLSHLASPRTQRQLLQRPDSSTTIQTDSAQGKSLRSSVATYLSEGSEDLQLPYSPIDGLPMRSSNVPHPPSRPAPPQRDTFLSEISEATTETEKTNESSPSARDSVRDSHIVVLDPLDRQLLREEIPSQLFLESPFLGWEARANMQMAR